MRKMFMFCFMFMFFVFSDNRGSPKKVHVNALRRVEACADIGPYASHVVFEFSGEVKYKYKVIGFDDRDYVEIVFKDANVADFKALNVARQLKRLPGIKSVETLFELGDVDNASRFAGPQVIVKISFKKDYAIFKLTPISYPNNYVIFDVYPQDMIKMLERPNTLRGCRDLQGFPGIWRKKFLLCQREGKKKRRFASKKLNIVIDAGHGGRDFGASSFGLKEKKITLDIAKKAYAYLKKAGYRVFLTRSTDTYLSVVDRFQLAQQLKADLFISIHVNASSSVQSASGIETHFLDGNSLLANKKLFFAKKNQEKVLSSYLDKILRDKIDVSQVLSHNIQKSIISLLQKRHISIVDRGIKKTVFRTLMRSQVPSSIVEVGFVTNKNEAKRLNQDTYRALLAQGICRGIRDFLVQNF